MTQKFEAAMEVLTIHKKRLEVQDFDTKMKYYDPEFACFQTDNKTEITKITEAIKVLEREGEE